MGVEECLEFAMELNGVDIEICNVVILECRILALHIDPSSKVTGSLRCTVVLSSTWETS